MPHHNVNRAASETAFWTKALLFLPYFWYVEGIRMFVRTFYRVVIYLDQATATT
ncbi:MAG: hypothetical protein Q8P12_02555 [bacterium]|nr:hypothetical protein [bacterium]